MRENVGSFLGVNLKKSVGIPHQRPAYTKVVVLVNREPCAISHQGKDFHPYEAG